jgi:hypothetical protein
LVPQQNFDADGGGFVSRLRGEMLGR